MHRLNEELHSSLTKPVIRKLFEKNIYTTTQFIDTDSGLLSSCTGLEHSQIIQIRNAIQTKFASPMLNGYEYYRILERNSAIISSGIERLDQLLSGGFSTGHVYELCGFSGCGKTRMCMTVALNASAKIENKKILYIDTKNDFYSHKLAEIIVNRNIKAEVMTKIKVCCIKSAYELIDLLHSIISELKVENTYRVIMIDSLAAIFYQFLGDDQNEGLCLLNNMANILHYIAVNFYAAVIVTNLATTSLETFTDSLTIRQPALGKYWAHVPNTRINMQRLENSPEILLTILKSLDQPVGKTIKLTLSNEGVT